MVRRLNVGPGIYVWPIPHTSLEIMWSGPGSRLLIGTPMLSGGAVTHIDHPTADGVYMTLKDANRAVAAFIAAGTKDNA
jgi:hypothetical protein